MSKQKSKKQGVSAPLPVDITTTTPVKDWLFLLPLVVTFLAYIPTFENGFVNWDDRENITENPWIQSLSFEYIIKIFTTDVIGNYNPLPIATFAIEKALFGMENLATVIHTNNLILHLICVFLVFRLSSEMGLSRWGSVFVALLFGIHPMRVESIAWATERKDVLFASFYFGALLQYVKYLKSNNYMILNKNLCICFGLFVLSLFSKVQAVSLPLSMLAMDYYFRRPVQFSLLLEKAHFFLGSLAMGLVNVMMLKKNQSLDIASLNGDRIIAETATNFNFFERIVIACHSFTIYLAKCIFPWKMLPVYPYPPSIPAYFYVTAALFIASIGFTIWAYRKGWINMVFGWLFFFVNFIFVSQIVGAGQGFLADRFTYVGYFGFFFLAVYLLTQLKNENFLRFGLSAYLVLSFFMTWNQIAIWKNGDTLWTHQIDNEPNNASSWQSRGIWFRDNQQVERAIADFNQAINLNPKDATLYNSRGKALAEMNQYDKAVHDFTMAIKLKPDLMEALSNRGAAYGALNKIDSTLADLNAVISKDPNNADAFMNRGMALDLLGQIEASVKDFSKVIELEPFNTDALLNRSLGYDKLKQYDKAITDCDSYIGLKKDNPQIWLNRAILKKRLGKCNEAITDFTESLNLDGTQGAIYAERAGCYFQLGNLAQCKADAQKAIANGEQSYVDARWLQ